MSLVRYLPVLLAGAALAACQPLPQPFKPPAKGATVSPLIKPIGESSVFVQPVAGLPESQGRALADAIAGALDDKDIPATATYRNPLSSDLAISVERTNGSATWQWQLSRPGQEIRTGAPQPLRNALDAAARSDSAADRKQLAEALVAVIAPALLPDLPESAYGSDGKKIAVRDCDGAPGDGNRSLRQAMREIMILANRAPTADPTQADYVIGCSVRVWSDSPDSERVTIEWALLAPAGTRLGEVKQANRIPRGQLDGPWGRTAHVIAQGGWQGITEILDRQRRSGPAGGVALPPPGLQPKS